MCVLQGFRSGFPEVFLAAVFSIQVSYGATNILNYDPDLFDRFDSSSFVGDSLDWSGVGREEGSRGRWATMIGPRHFLSVNHFRPRDNSDIIFHENNDSAGPTVRRTAVSGQRIGNTDIWVGELDSSVPASVRIYDVSSTILDLSSSLGSLADTFIYTVGLRDSWDEAGTTNFAVSFNNLEVGDSTAEANGDFQAVGFVRDVSGDPNLNDPGESFLQIGDSGAPSFVDMGGQLTIVGLHSYTVSGLGENFTSFGDFVESQSPNSPYNQTGPPVERDISFDNFLGNYRDDILQAVPEPSYGAFFLGLSGLALVACRRRRV